MVLQAAIDNKVCQWVRINGEHKSDDGVKQLMTILMQKKIQMVGCAISCVIYSFFCFL